MCALFITFLLVLTVAFGVCCYTNIPVHTDLVLTSAYHLSTCRTADVATPLPASVDNGQVPEGEAGVGVSGSSVGVGGGGVPMTSGTTASQGASVELVASQSEQGV